MREEARTRKSCITVSPPARALDLHLLVKTRLVLVPPVALAGNYSVTLDSGETGTAGLSPAAIAQTGLIPPSTSALLFLAYGNVNGYLTVTVGGQNIPFIPIAAGPNNSELYGGNISAYAGLTEQLSFTENVMPPNPEPVVYLDNIQFSNQGIPEPGSWALMLCGAAALMVRRFKVFRKQN